MLRLLLAGGLMLALASAGASQSVSPDDAPSPMEIISKLLTQPAASEATKAPGVDTSADTKPGARDAAKGPEATAKPDAANKPDAAKPGTAATKAAAAKREADSLQQCLNDWDKATHMTRAEWARTCRRVVTNRARFLSEQQGK